MAKSVSQIISMFANWRRILFLCRKPGMKSQITGQDKFWFLLFGFARLATGKNMNPSLAPVRTDNSISWFDIRQLGVEGRGWNDTKAFYDRLPAKAEGFESKA